MLILIKEAYFPANDFVKKSIDPKFYRISKGSLLNKPESEFNIMIHEILIKYNIYYIDNILSDRVKQLLDI